MGDVLVSLLPLMAGAAIVPIWLIIELMLLSGQNGLAKAAAFVTSTLAVRLTQGAVFGALLGAADKASGSDDGTGPIAATLLLVIGILMTVSGVRSVLQDDDPDGPPPKWLAMLDGLSPLKAAGLGAVIVLLAAKHWVFTLSAIGVIHDGDLDRPQRIGAFLLYLVPSYILLFAPVVATAVSPARAAALLSPAKSWLELHNKKIKISVSLIFGLFFLYQGVTGLLD